MDQLHDSGGFLVSPISRARSRLFRCKEAPLIFFGRHKPELLDQTPTVAIVGSRRASPDALSLTKKFAGILARNKINVVSWGAIGIDQAAHLGALEQQGTSIVVSGLVCGVDQKRASCFERFTERLLMLYPFGPFAPQQKFMFVERNRNVASLADRVVVIQGKRGSGTLHTASFAKQLKIPIFALPGAFSDPLSFSAPNHLLAIGDAHILTDFEQFAESLMTKAAKPIKRATTEIKEHTEKNQAKTELPYILQVMHAHNNTLNFDELMRLTGCSFAVLQRELLNYELAGRITKRGAQFVLTGN